MRPAGGCAVCQWEPSLQRLVAFGALRGVGGYQQQDLAAVGAAPGNADEEDAQGGHEQADPELGENDEHAAAANDGPAGFSALSVIHRSDFLSFPADRGDTFAAAQRTGPTPINSCTSAPSGRVREGRVLVVPVDWVRRKARPMRSCGSLPVLRSRES